MSVMIRVNSIVYSLESSQSENAMKVGSMTSVTFAPFLQYVNVPTVMGEIVEVESVAMYSSGTIVKLGNECVVQTKIKKKSEDDFEEVLMSLDDFYDAPTSVLQSFWDSFAHNNVFVSRLLDKMSMPSTMVSKSSKLTKKGMLLLETMPQFVPSDTGGGWAIKQPTPSSRALALKASLQAAVKIKEEKAVMASVMASVMAVQDIVAEEDASEDAPEDAPEEDDAPEEEDEDFVEEAEEDDASSEEDEEPKSKKLKVDVMADIDRDIKRSEFYLKRAQDKMQALGKV